MSGLFGTFNIAKSGLYAQQEALNVTSHNIANASTDGYTRQKVNLETTAPQNLIGAGQIGTGVQVASITRVKDDFLDYQIRTQQSDQGMYTAKDDVLSQVETVMNEPSDTGISSLIGNFYNSWQQLSNSASDTSLKQVVSAQSLALTDQLNSTYSQFQDIKTSAVTSIQDTVSDVNNLLTQISKVNQDIIKVSLTNQQPNDLMDTRDKLLSQLSSDIGINVVKKDNNGIDVTLTGTSGSALNLVNVDTPDISAKFSCSVDVTTGNSIVQVGGVTTEITTGSLSGYISAQSDVQQSIDQINTFARALTFSVNAVATQSSEYKLDSTDGYNIFVNKDALGSEAGINAGNITLNSAIKKDSTLIVTGTLSTSGSDDGARALAIADLQNVKDITGTNTSSRNVFLTNNFSDPNSTGISTMHNTINGVTTDSYYNGMIDNIGIKVQQAEQMQQNQTAVIASFQQSKASVSGVSLDEEMANLVQYQHAYQANAKIISTIDQLLDVVINGLKK